MRHFDLDGRCSKCLREKGNTGHRWCRPCLNYYQRQYRKVTEPSEEEKAKIKARSIAQRLARRGVLKPEPCEMCGGHRVEMHHDDYSKPEVVRWLCRPCHRNHHDDQANRRCSDNPGDWPMETAAE